jgi:eukaryotic-like serine/threonine-protein kinase
MSGATGMALAAGPAWPQHAFDAANTWNNTQEKTLKNKNVKQLRQLSIQQLGQFYLSATTQSDGVLFACSNLNGLSAIDVATGSTVWSRFGFGGNCHPAALDASSAYVSTFDAQSPQLDTLTAVNRADGATRWTAFSTPPGSSSYLGFRNPTLSKGSLYVTNGRSLVSAFDAATGQLRWQAATGKLNNEAAVANELVFVSTWGGEGTPPHRLFAFSVADGSLAWSQPTDTTNSEFPPAISAGRVFVASDSGALRAFDALTGAPLWSHNFSGYVSAPIVATPEMVIINSGSRTLTALNASTGALLWSTVPRGTDTVSSNLVMANNVLYFGALEFGGTLRLSTLNALSGKLGARIDDMLIGSYAQFTVVGGRVYASTNSGYLQIFGLP